MNIVLPSSFTDIRREKLLSVCLAAVYKRGMFTDHDVAGHSHGLHWNLDVMVSETKVSKVSLQQRLYPGYHGSV